MAVSGTGGAYYRSNASLVGYGLHATYTMHIFTRSSVATTTAATKTICGLVGDTSGDFSNQRPHQQIHWSHVDSGVVHAASHRQAVPDVYVASQFSAPSIDVWHSCASVYDGTNILSYLDGIPSTPGAVGAGVNHGVYADVLAAVLSSGGYDTGQFSDGEVAEYAVWNVALSADEIVSLSKGFRASRVRPASLVFYAPCIRDQIDVRHGRTMTKLAGADVFSDHPRVL